MIPAFSKNLLKFITFINNEIICIFFNFHSISFRACWQHLKPSNSQAIKLSSNRMRTHAAGSFWTLIVVWLVKLWRVYTVRFWAVPDERWPTWKKRSDIFGHGTKTVVLHHSVREVQRWPLSRSCYQVWDSVRNLGWPSHNVIAAMTYV